MKALARVLTPTGAIRAWATVTMLILGFGLALGLTIGYVNKVDEEAERRNVERQQQIERNNIERNRDWCRIIVMLDDRNQTLPPAQDKETADFRAALHDLRISKGC